MALYVTPDKKAEGEKNFQGAVGHTYSRRGFLKGMAAAGGAAALGGAAYFGYQKLHGDPVRTALIGTGDEGGVLMGYHNPEYTEIVAVCDIRPSNQKRIFTGDLDEYGEAKPPRLGLNSIYGKQTASKIRVESDYKKLLDDKSIEAVIIALPLHLHAQVAIDCMDADKHVLCEKLMAWNIKQCKDMIRKAEEKKVVLSIGHQRHYSILYRHALDVIQDGHLGDIKHIRALWHRNNTWPRLDKDGKPLVDARGRPMYRDGWCPAISKEDSDALENTIRQNGYKSMEELVRWRLFERTGGGLMAELGSHQLDACSIFMGKVKPLAVTAVGSKSFYLEQYQASPPEREVHDHVYTLFEFPGPKYAENRNDVIVVSYSSINTNSFEPYGECVMGSRGTMTVEMEQAAAFYPERDPNVKAPAKGMTVGVSTAGKGKAAADTSSTTGYADPNAQAAGKSLTGSGGPVSRGYREEMEDFAYCVRMLQKTGDQNWRTGDSRDPKESRGPRCHGKVAMADAIIALTANQAMKSDDPAERRIVFDADWFDPASPKVPDPKMVPEKVS